MGKKETVEVLIEGGKASAAPPVGSTLGPLGVNIGKVVSEINKQTAGFKGMKVPVKIVVDKDTKEFNIEVGTPPVSQLIKKELALAKGSSMPKVDKVANIAMEQVIKIAKMKGGSFLVNNLKSAVKVVIGSCHSMGILIEGKNALEINELINSGIYDDLIKLEKTDVDSEKAKILKEDLDRIQQELEKQRAKLKKVEKPSEKKEEEKVGEETKEEPAKKEEVKKKEGKGKK